MHDAADLAARSALRDQLHADAVAELTEAGVPDDRVGAARRAAHS